MPDVYHNFGNDLVLSAGGDLLTAANDTETEQRILRRLLTPQGGYIWNLQYGAGLPALIGTTTGQMAIRNAIRAQILQEETVAALPPPVVTVTKSNNGTFVASISYTDATSGASKLLTVPVA